MLIYFKLGSYLHRVGGKGTVSFKVYIKKKKKSFSTSLRRHFLILKASKAGEKIYIFSTHFKKLESIINCKFSKVNALRNKRSHVYRHAWKLPKLGEKLREMGPIFSNYD